MKPAILIACLCLIGCAGNVEPEPTTSDPAADAVSAGDAGCCQDGRWTCHTLEVPVNCAAERDAGTPTRVAR